MEIILHAHHAEVTESLREPGRIAPSPPSSRLRRVANAIVRFEGDGPSKRVEIVLQAPRHAELWSLRPSPRATRLRSRRRFSDSNGRSIGSADRAAPASVPRRRATG
jgi:hypothetical protein